MTELARALPKPKYSGFDEDLPAHVQKFDGPKIVAGNSAEGQLILKSSGPPAYGGRAHWRPRSQADYGDGGAFPECHIAQYPLDMGKSSKGTSNALVLKEGDSVAETIAKRGQATGKIVHASFKDLIPLRQRADVGEIDLSRPDVETIEATKRRTEEALQLLVTSATAAQKAKSIQKHKDEPTFVRYTAAQGQMGRRDGPQQDRIIKIVDRQIDPLAPNMWKKKKIPKGPAEPQVPIMHSPPRKPTEDELAMARLPPAISNWKNSKGYTIALDKRLAANGRGLEDKTINDKFSHFAEALYTADKLAREEVRQRATMQQRLNEREEEAKAERLRALAAKARDDRAAAIHNTKSRSRSRSDSRSSSDDESGSDSEDERVRARIKARRERDRENEKELRQTRMGAERRVQMMARESGRDISEKIALGLAKPTTTGEGMYDSRLFNQSSGFAAGINEDQAYDKPLFQAQDALSALYRPKAAEDDGEDEGQAYDRITKTKRFEGFGGANAEERQGPVQFEKEGPKVTGSSAPRPTADDPFGIDQMIGEVTGAKASGKKRYGLQADDVDDGRQSKRARVDSDEE